MNPVEAEIGEVIALQRRGDLAAAERGYRDLLDRYGPHPDVEHMLGVTLHAQGRSAEALSWFERASTERGDAMFWSNHAAALLAEGRAVEAAELGRRATRANPRHLGAWLNLGLACEIERNFSEAVSAFETALHLAPGNAIAIRALARCRLRIGEPAAALRGLDALAVGTDAVADLLRCEAWIEQGEVASATALLPRLAENPPTRIDALLLQARIAEQEHSNGALALLEQVLELDPGNRQATLRRAWIRINRGETEIGLRLLREWLDDHPEDQSVANGYLVVCNCSEQVDPARLAAEHRRLRPPPTKAETWPAGWQSNQRRNKLRIGWVSAADVVGLIGIFFDHVLQEFANVADDIEHVFYALRDESALSTSPSIWQSNRCDVSRLGDAQLLDRIRSDSIDILVDMVGRAEGNRLAVFAARAAPVQVGWFDAIYPSGVDAMDYLITDPQLSPAGAEAHFSEKLLRLPYGRLAYNPPPAAAPRLDGLTSNVFVCLNRFSKLGDGVVKVWSAILRELPDWTLHLKAKGGEDADLQATIRARFAAHGIAPERISISGRGTYAEAMEAYQASAIVLDPFPFSGCANTYDALWMGLPVVTWPRETIASRQSAALLEALGLSAWIATDAESYVAKAVGLAHDEATRRNWRLTARARVFPALCDAPRFARELLDALRSIALPRK